MHPPPLLDLERRRQMLARRSAETSQRLFDLFTQRLQKVETICGLTCIWSTLPRPFGIKAMPVVASELCSGIASKPICDARR